MVALNHSFQWQWQWCLGKKILPSHRFEKMTIVEVYDQYLESVISADEDDDGGENDDDDDDDAGDQNLKHLQSVLEAWRWWHKT